jgi:hypothetical protein
LDAATLAGGQAISQTVQTNQAPVTTTNADAPLSGGQAPSALPPAAPLDVSKQVTIDPSDAVPTPPPPKEPEEEHRKRKVAGGKPPSHGGGQGGQGGNGGMGATIRALEMNGHKFELENNGTVSPVAPGGETAPAGGQ